MPPLTPAPSSETPLVTVVVPVCGPAPHLEAALRTVAAQTYPALEVVVVDDRAAPRLEARVHTVLPDARVVASRAPGLSAARNTGIAAGSAPLVAFLDSDDLWVAHKLERQVEALEASKRAGLACTAFFEFTGDEVTVLRPRRTDFREGHALLALMLDDLVIPSAVVCRRELLEAASGFPEQRAYFEDFALFWRLARMTPFTFLPEPLVLYRRHELQMTQVVTGGVLEARSELTAEALSGLPVGARLRRRVAAHDHYVAGQWHRRQGRRGEALRAAARVVARWPFNAEPYALAGLSVLPPPLERGLRAAAQARRARAELSPAIHAALEADRGGG